MTHLSNGTLSTLPPNVGVPKYDRQALAVGWVHLGVGGFHRAHQAVYLDDLLGLSDADPSWGLCGVGLRPADAAMRDALHSQECLYTVIERSQDGDTARVIGSMIDYLFAPDDGDAVLSRLAAPETRLVTLTITEGGYDPSGPAARVLCDALERRRREHLAPFTVLSCDNIQHNGDAARRMVLDAAQARDPDLAAWIEREVTFPNAMVDRITPQTTDKDRTRVQHEFGINDAWPVVCEPFRQWVIEAKFVQGRPALERVGAQFVPDVTPYETMKIRLLNGSHSAMGYLGALAGFSYIHEVMADGLFVRYIQALMAQEV
ncbi:MAG: mannitol dehydrogenase family protein, partial [Armatimonadota bacterium]|nr:mannitol dehydrogenase family protein [Armatimonadota bacterium]